LIWATLKKPSFSSLAAPSLAIQCWSSSFIVFRRKSTTWSADPSILSMARLNSFSWASARSAWKSGLSVHAEKVAGHMSNFLMMAVAGLHSSSMAMICFLLVLYPLALARFFFTGTPFFLPGFFQVAFFLAFFTSMFSF
jgi:hypothetical protein